MSIVRVPVSLKLDTDDDFYINFFAPKRDDRELSEFILGIMRAYYEHPKIKELVDEVLEANTPFAKIRKQIERINLEHSKTIMATSMLSHHIQAHAEKFQGAVGVETGGAGADAGARQVMMRLEALERSISEISEKLSAVLNPLQSSLPRGTGESLPTSSPSFDGSRSDTHTPAVQPQVQDKLAEEVLVQPQPQTSIVNPSINPTPNYDPAIVSSPVQSKEPEIIIESTPSVVSGTPLISIAVEEEEEPRNRPPSFGKLKSSLAKKD